MTPRRTALALGLALMALSLSAPAVHAQDALTRAKDFYASAAYEEALAALESVHDSAAETPAEASAYEVLCLVALGRSEQARQVIETIVRRDPQYHFSETQASPRVRTLFETVRRPMLPALARESYSSGKIAFERQDLTAAVERFDRVIALIDEIGNGQDAGLADLRLLASGFRDLTKKALSETVAAPSTTGDKGAGAAAPVALSAAPAAPGPATPAGRVTETSQGIAGPDDPTTKRPVPISQAYPPWQPATLIEQRTEYNGYLELMIDETGRVTSVTLLKSVHPRYDAALVEAAKHWTFRPATKDGRPVKYRYMVGVKLGHR
jgi:TonB family protein